jgi:hypothetical protein
MYFNIPKINQLRELNLSALKNNKKRIKWLHEENGMFHLANITVLLAAMQLTFVLTPFK